MQMANEAVKVPTVSLLPWINGACSIAARQAASSTGRAHFSYFKVSSKQPKKSKFMSSTPPSEREDDENLGELGGAGRFIQSER